MYLDLIFIRSRLGRRFFLLFISCALLPVAALAILSFSHVTRQVNEQSQKRLHQASRAMGMAIMERLLFLEGEIGLLTSSLDEQTGPSRIALRKGRNEGQRERFNGISLLQASGNRVPLFKETPVPRPISEEGYRHLRTGKCLLQVLRAGRGGHILMVRALHEGNLQDGLVVADVNPLYLWGMLENNTLPALTEACVLDSTGTPLFSSAPPNASLFEKLRLGMKNAPTGRFEWSDTDRHYLGCYWSLFLKFRFHDPRWTVVMSQSKAEVFSPMADFEKTFFLVVLLTLWVVLFLTILQIRRSLHPLQRLKEGTSQIAKSRFDTRVVIESGDEFEELGHAFNHMARRLGIQFSALAALGEIDRAVLSTLQTDRVVDTTLTHIRELFHCDLVGMVIPDRNSAEKAQCYVGSARPASVRLVEAVRVLPEHIHRLRRQPLQLIGRPGEDLPEYLHPLVRRGYRSFLVLPIFTHERLSAIVSLAYLVSPVMDEEDYLLARQIADQVGVALSNAQLMEQFEELSWGTLLSLARAVDTKSAWTGGHSERVTELAIEIGRELTLDPTDLLNLHRGGLLHDVGKIGIPSDILDKPGKLTREEYEIIKKHPSLGMRILEPIKNYGAVMELVLHHHERFDGKGYPEGLSGDRVSLGARILAVADVFDALVSDRPYREGMKRDRALAIIREESGRQFDPAVVEAFFRVIVRKDSAAGKGSEPQDLLALGARP
ncbi:MAG: HD domain-containing protein [Deltaproteobacteria bacterium]|nr:HD domain-containing protein [Deltaproteobacteria bacterium]